MLGEVAAEQEPAGQDPREKHHPLALSSTLHPFPLSFRRGEYGAMAAEPKADLAVRPGSQTSTTTDNQPSHKHSRSLQSETARPAVSPSLSVRPAKRSMPAPRKTIAVINASGRQAASLIRYATAVGYHVRAQMRNQLGVIATEVATNPSVTVLEGELYTHHDDGPMEEEERDDNDDDEGEEKDEVEGEQQELKKEKRGEEQQQQRRRRRQRQRQRRSGAAGMVDATKDLSDMGVNHALISELFRGAELAFINTTFYGDEIRIGEALANAAKTAGVQHYVYSSMPDHAAYDGGWPSLPLWAPKHAVEEYARHIGLPATFVYTGIYNNNFTSLPYPLFCMELQPDGSFVWRAPFHPDARLPWLDAEHDIGPAILQIFKTGVDKWGHGRRIALAYEVLTPREALRRLRERPAPPRRVRARAYRDQGAHPPGLPRAAGGARAPVRHGRRRPRPPATLLRRPPPRRRLPRHRHAAVGGPARARGVR